MLEQGKKKKHILKNWMLNMEDWSWQETRWQVALLFAGPLPLAIFLFWRDFWNQHVYFILLDVLTVGVLYILHYHRKYWRENRWIVMPAAFVILVWVNSTWAQSYWSVENLQNLKTFPAKSSLANSLALRASYPAMILRDGLVSPSFSIWWDCRTQFCAAVDVEITSQSQVVEFGIKKETGIVWEKSLPVPLPSNGAAVEIIMRQIDTKKAQSERFFIITTYKGVSYPIGPIWVEGTQNAKTRKFWLELLKSSSVVITIVTAVFAALKQLDEQKQSERRKKIEETVTQIKNYKYERGKAKEFLSDVQAELYDWNKWLPEQREDFRNMFKKFVEMVVEKSISQEHYSSETSPWAQSAIATIETLGYAKEETKALAEKIIQAAPGYSPERYASRFPPELYPLQRRFARQSAPLPEEGKWGISDWQMRFAPFGDELNEQFKYVKDDDFPLLAAVNFQFLTSRFSHQAYYFQNAWDLRAGYYQYCRAFNSAELQLQSKQTFFVPALPEAIPIWEDKIQFQEYLLHNLAAAWLRVLANAPDITDKMGLWEIEAVARLIAWHYGSGSAIRVLSLPDESQIMRHLQGIKPENVFPVGEKNKWLALRPPETGQTLYLYAQVSLGGKSDESNAVHIPESLVKTLKKEAVFAVCFLLAEQAVHEQALRMSNEALLLLLNERVNMSTAGSKFFGDLFGEHPFFDDIVEQFLDRAGGSPGKILHMANTVLENHQQSLPENPYIDPDDLLKVNS